MERAPNQYGVFTARTTGVSNPVRYPGFRASASVKTQWTAFATGVPDNINAFHRSTISSVHLYLPQAWQYWMQFPSWAGGFHIQLIKQPTHPLSPVIPNNVWTVRITAAAGTNLARPSFCSRSKQRDCPLSLPPTWQRFTTRRPSSRTRRRSVRLSSIAEDSRLQPPVGVWAVSQSQWCGSRSHARYPSSPWWAITSPTS